MDRFVKYFILRFIPMHPASISKFTFGKFRQKDLLSFWNFANTKQNS